MSYGISFQGKVKIHFLRHGISYDISTRTRELKVPFHMNCQKKHLRHLLLHCTANEMCTTYRSDTKAIRNVCKWFKKFGAGNFDMKDKDRSGRPATMNTNLIKSVAAKYSRYSERKIVDATTTRNHLIKIR
uniref:Mos1 transposase HTH domain-containing protein n=1 Tax=Glossina austeni TaxID=7395 RepID=A0A1A9V8J3_GLOAU